MSVSGCIICGRLLTIPEVADRLQVSPATVYRRQGKIGTVKIGRAIRFRLEDVLAYIEAQRRYPAWPRPKLSRPRVGIPFLGERLRA